MYSLRVSGAEDSLWDVYLNKETLKYTYRLIELADGRNDVFGYKIGDWSCNLNIGGEKYHPCLKKLVENIKKTRTFRLLQVYYKDKRIGTLEHSGKFTKC